MSSFLRERIFYEIAMGIGNSLDLEVMLREALSTYLRKLNCLAGIVLENREGGDETTSFESVFSIPKRLKRKSVVRESLESIPCGLSTGAKSDFLLSLPMQECRDGLRHYLMELPGYGLLLLVKSDPGFSLPELKALAPINRKLAGACLACTANQRLQREILVREAAEEKYRSIFNNAVEGLYQSSMDGVLLEVNPAFARLLGFSSPREAVEGYTDLGNELYVHQGDRDRFLGRLAARGQVSAFEIEYRRKDGSTGWLSLSSRLVRDELGVPSSIEGMAEDITSRRQALAALREAKLEAERLSQLKSSIISMVSHELRTPLTSILGFSKITRKRILDIFEHATGCSDEIASHLKRIDTNTQVVISEGERLTELINNVLDLAKLEAGGFEWNMVQISMNAILEHSIAATEVLFQESGVELECTIEADLPPVLGDRDRMIQVVINLLSNAAKFTEAGIVKLGARVEDETLVVEVADTGVGVPPDEVVLIFDKFRQLGNTLTDKPKGTGLGLPICKEIVEHHNGRIWVESVVGEGSVFAFSLPISSLPD
ncbi:PAS domain-containing sensor histidine kinase [Pseudodesulfovibrio piezophilus]|uniref:histidine kinase n=1 Tax=Pseudodesulfovibrio piezophilus (strain DSM 21447 / JCM 15486 / C1TLV30) TaxID=1322246 RepID=M1WLZ1_PSEP2|nr:PAS domain-containing sensor histidine kinase [Pseudodesulfovibrio piezophilus]CCH48700.1 putative Histidine kinase [Pseudodesulfovibrio piezophilus C1TLV30]